MGTFLIDQLLSACISQRGSALFVENGRSPSVLVDGKQQLIRSEPLSSTEVQTIVRGVTPQNRVIELEHARATQFNFGFGDAARVCVSIRRDANDQASACFEIR